MSMSAALSNALSGLTASARASDVVSANLANSATESYGARELRLSASSLGGGVSVDGVSRRVDPQLLADRRGAEARASGSEVQTDFLSRLSSSIGEPGQSGSLTDRMAAFESALTSAASRPDSEARLSTVARRAEDVADKFNDISATIQTARTRADADIGREVETINRSLEQVADLNKDIRTARSSGRDPSGLLDERQKAIDTLSQSVPAKVLDRGDGAVSLMSEGGVLLVDGEAKTLDFETSPILAPSMDGADPDTPPHGVMLEGRGEVTDKLSGGRLEALFTQRDETTVANQRRVDELAADLVGRFQQGAGSELTTAKGVGLFTDGGEAFEEPATGLAGRISVNPDVDPEGGDLWKLRAGLDAAEPGVAGNRSVLQGFTDALDAKRPVDGLGPVAQTAAQAAGALTSSVAADHESAEANSGFHRAESDGLRELELQNGVDTDQEIQKLLTIERAYSANARVLQTADDMMQTLLGI